MDYRNLVYEKIIIIQEIIGISFGLHNHEKFRTLGC